MMFEADEIKEEAKKLLKFSLGVEYYSACIAAKEFNDMLLIKDGVRFPEQPVKLVHGLSNQAPMIVVSKCDDEMERIERVYSNYARIFNNLIGYTFPKERIDVLKGQMSELLNAPVGLRPIAPTHRKFWSEAQQGDVQLNIEFSKDQSLSYIIRGYSMPHEHLFRAPQQQLDVA